jgi:hypothetical protein
MKARQGTRGLAVAVAGHHSRRFDDDLPKLQTASALACLRSSAANLLRSEFVDEHTNLEQVIRPQSSSFDSPNRPKCSETTTITIQSHCRPLRRRTRSMPSRVALNFLLQQKLISEM